MCALLAFSAASASASRDVYFADQAAGGVAQYAVGASGSLAPLVPTIVGAGNEPRRLAMTPDGKNLYVTTADGVRQYDVHSAGHLSPKSVPLVAAGLTPGAIAVHPSGGSVYVADVDGGAVRQYDVGAGGRLVPMSPPAVGVGDDPSGLAVAPNGRTLYATVDGGIAQLGVNGSGALGGKRLLPVSSGPQDMAFTPDGKSLYATFDAGVLQFDVAADGTPRPKDPGSVAVKSGAHPVALTVAPNGRNVWVAATGFAAGGERHLFQFAVTAGGALVPLNPPDLGEDIEKPAQLAPTPNGRSLYIAADDAWLFNIGSGGLLSPKSPAILALGDAKGLVVSPNQVPVAGFIAATGAAGSPTVFDAAPSHDTDGRIVRWDWNFGDGTVLLNGGPRVSHVYTSPGSYTVTLTVTDNEGASTTRIFTGGTALVGGGGGPASELIVVTGAAAPRPDLGESVLLKPVKGKVRVRRPGDKRSVALESLKELPVGSVVDTRKGRVELTSVRDSGGGLQEGVFYSGVFKVRQRKKDRYVTEFLLQGKVGPCKSRRKRARSSGAVRAHDARRRRRRRLWGRGRGRFRTRGRHSSASVRGTTWLQEDRCGGTLTRVKKGTVTVRDFTRHKRVIVHEQQSYLAPAH